MDEDRAAVASTRLAWLLQGFGILTLGLCLLLFWLEKGDDLLDSLGTLTFELDELGASVLLMAAVILLLWGQSAAYALRMPADPYVRSAPTGPRLAFGWFVVDALSFLLLALVGLAAVVGPARARVMAAGVALWHLAMLVGQAQRAERGQPQGHGTVAHGVAAAAYVVLLVVLTFLSAGLRNSWWVSLIMLALALGVSLPALWRAVPR